MIDITTFRFWSGVPFESTWPIVAGASPLGAVFAEQRCGVGGHQHAANRRGDVDHLEARESRRRGQQHAQTAFVKQRECAAVEADVPVEVLR